jgi:hypothetical protein
MARRRTRRRKAVPKSGVDRAVATGRRSARSMRLNRVAARFFSGGHHQTFKAIVKSPFKPKTVGTPARMRKQHQQWNREASKKRAADRKAEIAARQVRVRAEQKAARTAARGRQRTAAAAAGPVNPRTGKPITWAQAQTGMRGAAREVERIEGEQAGKTPRRQRPRAAKPVAPSTPLRRAVADVKKNNPAPRKPAAPRKAPARKPAKPKPSRAKVQPLPPVLAGSPPPALQRPGRSLTGIAMAATCECQGTGRIVVYGPDGNPNGSTSCPTHGRAGAKRGAKRLTTKRAIRDSGLPGLAKWLDRRRTKKRGNADGRQLKAKDQARRQVRHAGPTRACPRPTCEGGLVDRWVTLRLRKQHEDDARDDAARLVRAAVAHNARVAETGDGREMKVPKMPDERKLKKASRLEFPHSLCPTCGGLEVVETSARLMQDGQQPVAEWRADARLRKGRRLTARERATGKKPTENARQVERRRKLPRI